MTQPSDPIQRLAERHEELRMQCMCQWLSEPPIDQSTHKVCHGTGWALRPRAELLGVLVNIVNKQDPACYICFVRMGRYHPAGYYEGELVCQLSDGINASGPDPETALALAILEAEGTDGN